jgi:hypothetical protein
MNDKMIYPKRRPKLKKMMCEMKQKCVISRTKEVRGHGGASETRKKECRLGN